MRNSGPAQTHNDGRNRVHQSRHLDKKTTGSFGRDDLLVLAKVADLAYSRILELEEPSESD